MQPTDYTFYLPEKGNMLLNWFQFSGPIRWGLRVWSQRAEELCTDQQQSAPGGAGVLQAVRSVSKGMKGPWLWMNPPHLEWSCILTYSPRCCSVCIVTGLWNHWMFRSVTANLHSRRCSAWSYSDTSFLEYLGNPICNWLSKYKILDIRYLQVVWHLIYMHIRTSDSENLG